MTKDFSPNYIRCPECKNVLNLSFADGKCPNPLCGFNFDGLRPFLDQDDDSLRRELKNAHKENDKHKRKILITAIRFNIGNYFSHFITCTWDSHYNTLFKDFITRYLDDLNILKDVLKSDVIDPDKGETEVSKNGYKMFWELYKYLMKLPYPDIKIFLNTEFPKFRRKYRREQKERHHQNSNQKRLI